MTVDEILEKFKKTIKEGTYIPIDRAKNLNSRHKYGITMQELEDFFLTIDKNDLYEGPTKDYDFPEEELFVFKKEFIPGVMFYVKIKDYKDTIKIISFHEDEPLHR